MSKKIHRYVRAVDPIRKRFKCTLMQAGDYIEKLLSFERDNEKLREELVVVKANNHIRDIMIEDLKKEIEILKPAIA